jgi:hypothetical protein
MGCNDHQEREKEDNSCQNQEYIRHEFAIFIFVLENYNCRKYRKNPAPEQQRAFLPGVKSGQGIEKRKTPTRVSGDVFNLKISRYQSINHGCRGQAQKNKNRYGSVLSTGNHFGPAVFNAENRR